MDLLSLFIVKKPKEDTSVLIRLGRVTHYALSALGWAAMVFFSYTTFGNATVWWTPLTGVLCIIIGRAIRYILGEE